MVVASLSQLYQTITLFCLVSLADFLVFILHPATLIAVLRLIWLVFIILSELPPCVKLIPVLIESPHFCDGRLCVT